MALSLMWSKVGVEYLLNKYLTLTDNDNCFSIKSLKRDYEPNER